MNHADVVSPSERELAEAVDEIIGRLEQDGSVDASAVRERYPQFAREIEQLLPALRFLGNQHDISSQETIAKHTEDNPDGGVVALNRDIKQLGDFRIEGEIGRGGMGVVYRAREITLDRLVALKVLPFSAIVNERQLARFKVEAQAAAGLHHAGIVPVYSVGCDSGVHYYAMQYIDGTSLGVILSRLRNQQARREEGSTKDLRGNGSKADLFSISTALSGTYVDLSGHSTQHFRTMAELGIQAAEALEHAHQSGVIHRDIKPGNLMLDQGGRLWVTDFGLARIEQDSELTMTGDLVGTLRYMSPQQAFSPRTGTDPRCDIYSLGATLYEMFTLQRVFEGEDRQAIMDRIENQDPIAPSKVNPRIPTDLETIVLKALEKDPAARYQTAQALADDLRCFLQDRTISAKRPSMLARARKWARRHPASIRTAVAFLILIAIGLAVSSVLLKREQSQTIAALADSQRNYEDSERNRRLAEDSKTGLETQLHVGGLRLSARSLRDGDSAGALALMAVNPASEERPDLQGFPWRYLKNSLSPKHKTILRGAGEIYSVAYAPQGEIYATGDADGTIRLWGAEDDLPLKSIDGHSAAIHSLAFHPDRPLLVTVSADGDVRIWNSSNGKSIGELSGAHQGLEVFSVSFSHNGERFVTAGEDTKARVWATDSLKEIAVLQGHSRDIRSVAYSPDDRLIATASNDRSVRLWDADSGKPKRVMWGHNGMVLCVAFSKFGEHVISGSNDHTIRFWNTESGHSAAVVSGHLDGVQAIAALPDGKRFVAADRSGQMRIWKIAGKRVIDRYGDATYDVIHAVHFAPDGKSWAALSSSGRLLYRDLGTNRTNELQSGIKNEYPLAYGERLAFSPSGRHLFAADRILTRDAADSVNWERTVTLDMPAGAPGCFSPDSNMLATGWGNTIRLWNCSDGTMAREFQTPADAVAGLRFGGDRETLTVWFSQVPKVLIWDLREKKLAKELSVGDAPIVDLEYSSDGKSFATCSREGVVQIWNSESGESIQKLPVEERAQTVAWLYGDRAVAVGIPGTQDSIYWLDGSDVELIGENKRIWDIDVVDEQNLVLEQDYEHAVVVRDLKQLDVRSDVSDIMPGHEDRIWAVAVAPNGRTIMSSSRDGTVRRWEMRRDRWEWLTRRPHRDYGVDDLKWSRDGSNVFISRKSLCSIYQWPSGKLISERPWTTHRGRDPVGFAYEAVSVDPMGQWFATGHRDGTIRIWDSKMERLIETLIDFEADAGVWDLGITRDGRFLVACSHKQKTVRVWKTDDWSPHWSKFADDCDDFALSPKGDRLLYCDSCTAIVVDIETGAEVTRIPDQTITVHGVAFSPDGAQIATACEDRRLRVWDAESGELLKTFNGHTGSIMRVSFAPDRSTIVSGDADGSIRLWHLETEQEFYELAKLDARISKLRFDPSGNVLIAVTSEGRVHAFDGMPK